jgi:hypothetical protein
MSPASLNTLIAVVFSLSAAGALALYRMCRSRGARRFLFVLPMLVGGVILYGLAMKVEDILNPVAPGPLGSVSEEALALHRDSDVTPTPCCSDGIFSSAPARDASTCRACSKAA